MIQFVNVCFCEKQHKVSSILNLFVIRDRSVHAQNDVQSVTQQILSCTETVKAGRLRSVRHTNRV